MITRLLGPSLLLSPPVPFQAPPPRLSLVDDIRSSVQRRYRAEDVQRVLSAWDAMADGYVHEEELPGFEAEPMLRQQSNSYVDGLPIRLFYEEPARDFAWAQALEQHAHVVRDEFLSVMQSDVIEREGNDWTGLSDIRDESTVAYGPEWRTLGLLDRGLWDPVNCRLFPKTVALLKESKTPCVEAFFAKMPAGSSIGAHSDGCNFHLTSHLGIDVPEGEGWLQARAAWPLSGGGPPQRPLPAASFPPPPSRRLLPAASFPPPRAVRTPTLPQPSHQGRLHLCLHARRWAASGATLPLPLTLAMQVGGERREWRNGKLMLFDTSVMHCAANEAAVDRYVLMLRVWHPGLSPFEIDALSWVFKCLDNPQLAAPPPTDWSNPRSPEAAPGKADAAARKAAAAPRATSGMSRQARRQAEKKAKKDAKAKRARGFG